MPHRFDALPIQRKIDLVLNNGIPVLQEKRGRHGIYTVRYVPEYHIMVSCLWSSKRPLYAAEFKVIQQLAHGPALINLHPLDCVPRKSVSPVLLNYRTIARRNKRNESNPGALFVMC